MTINTERVLVEYTTLTEHEDGRVEAINYDYFGMTENGYINTFADDADAIYYFKDFMHDQLDLFDIVDDASYMGWGHVITAIDEDGNRVAYSLRIKPESEWSEWETEQAQPEEVRNA